MTKFPDDHWGGNRLDQLNYKEFRIWANPVYILNKPGYPAQTDALTL